MVYVCFFVSLFLVCSYVVLWTFFPFIRKLTYDFTFPVHILCFHWDFFDFMGVQKNPNENVKYEQGM